MNNLTVFLTRRYAFSASHRLYNPAFSDNDNWETFRECNNPNGHGHNYEFEVTVSGQPDEKTGMLIDPARLDALVERLIVKEVDHKHLNYDVPILEGCIPTAENLAHVFWNILQPEISKIASSENIALKRVRVFESKNNLAEYIGPVPSDMFSTDALSRAFFTKTSPSTLVPGTPVA